MVRARYTQQRKRLEVPMPISPRRSAVAAAVLAAACALTLSACGSSDGTSNASASNSASQQGAPDDGTTLSPSGNDGSSATQDPAAATTAPGTATTAPAGAPAGKSSGTPRCHTADLTLSFETGGDAAPDTTSDAQQTAGISVHNRSSHACQVGGFPGLDLNGGSTHWSLSRQSKHYSAITLAPGDNTDFQITFLPELKGKWTPKSVTVTPPNETTSVTLAWPWGPVLLQDGATHPGTYVGPIG
ncbi:DUF4232 domain-containing protein [Streptomyces sp. NPDC088194]|uniref:DUF4232 domain-containing protein n=1 Tax=Streptomyces sp. NPDC088194 TaxID=3154931 RepID=UPI00344E554D